MIRKILSGIKRRLQAMRIIENVNQTGYQKNCLMLYIKEPFLYSENQTKHQNYWQTKEIARIIGTYGYNVDIGVYSTSILFLKKKYDAVFDICAKEKSVYRNHLLPNAKKVLYLTGGESKFANNAEKERLANLKQRRGVDLLPRRQAPLIPKSITSFDKVIMIGNLYNLSTYSDFHLERTCLVPNTGYDLELPSEWNERKGTNFIYFGSYGCVHKGLDLLLEIFSEENFPCTLYVCGLYEKERDFFEEYQKELYHTKNIKPMGFVDIASEEFIELASKCAFSILPSCSEARAGAVATVMSAGIIPICSKECGYEDDEVINLENCDMEVIRRTILEVSEWDRSKIDYCSNKVLELVRTKYSRKAFTEAMDQALSDVL